MTTKEKIFITLLILFTSAFFLYGVYRFIGAVNTVVLGEKYKGTVIANIQQTDCIDTKDKKCTSYQVVKFTDSAGKSREAMSTNSISDGVRYGTPIDIYLYGDQVLVGSLPRIFMFPVIFILLGGVFSFGMGFAFYKYLKTQRDQAYAREHGSEVSAKISDIEEVKDNEHPDKPTNKWKIRAHWFDTNLGRDINFESEEFFKEDITELKKTPSVKVYVDSTNPYRYWMDLSSVGIEAQEG